MADILPPFPVDSEPNSYSRIDWYLKLRNLLNSANSVAWSVVDKSGSNLTDIQTRNHNDLQNVQGGAAGERNHLTDAQVTSLSGIGKLLMVSAAGDPTNTDISTSNAELWKNTTSGLVKLWVNDGGTMKSVLLT